MADAPKGRVEPTTLSTIATTEFSAFDQVHSSIAATNSTLYVANHHAAGVGNFERSESENLGS